MTLRRRLMVASLASLIAGLALLVVAGNLLLERRVRAETTGLLHARAEAQVAALSFGPRGLRVRDTPNDEILDKQAWVYSGGRAIERPLAASAQLDAAAARLATRVRPAQVAGPDDYRLLVRPVVGASGRRLGTVVVAQSTAAVEDLRDEVLVGSVVISLLVLLAGGLAIHRALRGALRPVAQMTAAAEDWSAHDLERRFGLGPARDELTALAATLDGLLGRIASSRRHEQRFAAEVAHELRTPLSGMLGRAELALRPGTSEAQRDAALETVVEQSARLAATIDTLLVIARQELAEAPGSVDVAALLGELQGVRVSVPAALPAAEGEPAVVARALAPLVDNARRHARSAVDVTATADAVQVSVTVRDDGPGVPPELRERVFDPGVQGAGIQDGAGLGLPLARRLARSCGGDVTVGDGPGGCFVLSLPRAGS